MRSLLVPAGSPAASGSALVALPERQTGEEEVPAHGALEPRWPLLALRVTACSSGEVWLAVAGKGHLGGDPDEQQPEPSPPGSPRPQVHPQASLPSPCSWAGLLLSPPTLGQDPAGPGSSVLGEGPVGVPRFAPHLPGSPRVLSDSCREATPVAHSTQPGKDSRRPSQLCARCAPSPCPALRP